MKRHQHTRGFTLIEALMYMALFGIIIGGAVTAAYSIAEASTRSVTRSLVQEEGNFLVAKIGWVLSGARAVDDPAVGNTGPSLSVTKWDTAIAHPIVVQLVGTDMTISRGTNPASILNNDNVQVSALSFSHAFGGGTDPESVEASFTVSARTPTGQIVNQNFKTIVYLRK